MSTMNSEVIALEKTDEIQHIKLGEIYSVPGHSVCIQIRESQTNLDPTSTTNPNVLNCIVWNRIGRRVLTAWSANIDKFWKRIKSDYQVNLSTQEKDHSKKPVPVTNPAYEKGETAFCITLDLKGKQVITKIEFVHYLPEDERKTIRCQRTQTLVTQDCVIRDIKFDKKLVFDTGSLFRSRTEARKIMKAQAKLK